MYFSGSPGETRGWSSTVPWRYSPWTTCWPVRSGPLTPSSTTGKNLLPTTWQHPTSCCAWWTTAPSCTPWGKLMPWPSRSLHTWQSHAGRFGSVLKAISLPPKWFLFLISDGIWSQVFGNSRKTLGWENLAFSSSLRAALNLLAYYSRTLWKI